MVLLLLIAILLLPIAYAAESLHFPNLHSLIALGLCKSDGNFKQYLVFAAADRVDQNDAITQILRICQLWNGHDIYQLSTDISNFDALIDLDYRLEKYVDHHQLPLSLDQAFRNLVIGFEDSLPKRLFQIDREESSSHLIPRIYDFNNHLSDSIQIDYQNVPAYIVAQKPSDLQESATIPHKIITANFENTNSGLNQFEKSKNAVYLLDLVFTEIDDEYQIVKPTRFLDGECAWQVFEIDRNSSSIKSKIIDDKTFQIAIVDKPVLFFYRFSCILPTLNPSAPVNNNGQRLAENLNGLGNISIESILTILFLAGFLRVGINFFIDLVSSISSDLLQLTDLSLDNVFRYFIEIAFILKFIFAFLRFRYQHN